MNFLLRGELSHITKQSWKEIAEQMQTVYENFEKRSFLTLDKRDHYLHLKVSSSLLEDAKPFYEIMVDWINDTITIQCDFVSSVLDEANGLVGCLKGPDLAKILDKCQIDGGLYTLVNTNVFVFIKSDNYDRRKLLTAVYGKDNYLMKVWQENESKNINSLLYNLRNNPRQSFEEFINKFEIQSIAFKDFLPVIEKINPGTTKELEEWHELSFDKVITEKQAHLQSRLESICYVTTKPELSKLLTDTWVESELQWCAEYVAWDNFLFTRNDLPVKEIAERFDKLLNELKQTLVEEAQSNESIKDESVEESA